MTEVRGSLAGAEFSFRCDHPAVAAYARLHLAPLERPVERPLVVATLRWHDGQPPLDALRQDPALAQMTRVDRDLYRGNGELRWLRVDDLRDLFVRVRWTGERLEIEADFYHRLGNSPLSDGLRRIRQWRSRIEMMQRRFPTLLAYLVYYPCWWWLERARLGYPIHAAGVATPDGVVLLAGTSGVGKSTLAVALAAEAGAGLVSDSFVLHAGAEVRPVREPILLDEWSRRWLGERAAILQPLGWRYGLQRSGFLVKPERWSNGGRAVLLVFPRRAPAPFVREVNPEHAHQWLSAGGLIINDLRRYWAFAAVLEQLESCGLMARREAELAVLTEAVSCVEVGITPFMRCDETTAAIRQLIRGPARRAAVGRG